MKRCALLLSFCLLTFRAGAAPAQPATLVTDVNTSQEDFVEPLFTGVDFAVLGTTVFFLHDDGIHGIEVWKTDGAAAGTALVKDVCPGACWPRTFHFAVAHGRLFFGADDGVHGYELWVTDGSDAGTFLLRDVNPGIGNALRGVKSAAGTLFFTADDGVHGIELWKSDGTPAGTQMVADLLPGSVGSDPWLSLDLGGSLLLNADDGVHGREPWLSDGTAAGTAMLLDINPGAGDSSLPGNFIFGEPDAFALTGGGFLFSADDGVHGYEPWRSDGTGAGTALVKDLNPNAESSSPYGFRMAGSALYFGAQDADNGRELWKTDGTGPGTQLVKDIYPGTFGSAPRELTVLGGQLFFIAFEPAGGRELWRSDGTGAGTVQVKDILPGTDSGFVPWYPFRLRVLGSSLLFFADDGIHGAELWKSDGTAAGTALLADIYPGVVPGFGLGFSGLTVAGSRVFFHAIGVDGLEPWRSDGTAAGTVEVKNITTQASGLVQFGGFLTSSLQKLGDRLLFDAEDGVSGLEPWATDGTAAATGQLADLAPGPDWGAPTLLFPAPGLLHARNTGDLWKTDGTPAGTSPLVPAGTLQADPFLASLGSSWLFAADNFTAGSELWKTDGTAAGTVLVKDIWPGNNGSSPSALTVLGSSLLFEANDGTHGYELWKSDGTPAGTVLVKDLSASSFGGRPGEITPLGSVAVFTAYDAAGTDRDLWKTDGTPAGTVLLRASAGGLVRLGNTVLFLATSSAGRELWKTDGTAAGTGLLADIRPGIGSSFSNPYFNQGNTQTVVGNKFFFLADDGVSGAELWQTDGTTAALVKDVYPGSRSAEITWMTPLRGRLFFVADDGVHGRELWVTDGTPAGTRLVKDIVPGPGSPVIQSVKAMGRLLLFNATDGVNGVEPWKSDGTEAGTVMLQDVAPGAASSTAMGFTSAFPNVYFAANDNVTGFELWSLPWTALGSTFADVPVAYWAWRYVEALADGGFTTGCGNGLYCPAQTVTRAEVSVFILRGIHGAGYAPPPATGTAFQDVPAGFWAAPWIERFAAEGFSSGCGTTPPLFCPETPVPRAQMAVFLLRARHGASYVPPPATGTVFQDVPAGYWAAAWIERLAAEGITSGCAPNLYCPDDPVGRDQMAVFLIRAFNLPLP
ncbi:MAG TPA: ELWxxDGT repeat protein [Thermoanaerobaculia bacterium]|nr:ELWxxDGT repeat protein [Thermoanaerobaculia bacterium]